MKKVGFSYHTGRGLEATENIESDTLIFKGILCFTQLFKIIFYLFFKVSLIRQNFVFRAQNTKNRLKIFFV